MLPQDIQKRSQTELIRYQRSQYDHFLSNPSKINYLSYAIHMHFTVLYCYRTSTY